MPCTNGDAGNLPAALKAVLGPAGRKCFPGMTLPGNIIGAWPDAGGKCGFGHRSVKLRTDVAVVARKRRLSGKGRRMG